MSGMMGLKKKKNIIVLTLCMVISYILYQLYFFLAITSEAGNGNRVRPVLDLELDHAKVEAYTHRRTEADKFIDINGLIRGVLYSRMSKYRPNNQYEFTCLQSGQRIPFEQVNDDYCDCEDGTDEPSTSACVNGTFYCETQTVARIVFLNKIPSSQVNDGICDCCDGSDEWKNDPANKLLSQVSSKFYRYYVKKCPYNCA